jgi:hypothetical protein
MDPGLKLEVGPPAPLLGEAEGRLQGRDRLAMVSLPLGFRDGASADLPERIDLVEPGAGIEPLDLL